MSDEAEEEGQGSKKARRMTAGMNLASMAHEVAMNLSGINTRKSAMMHSQNGSDKKSGHGPQEKSYEEDEQPYFESNVEEYVEDRDRFTSYRRIDDQKVEVYNPTLEPKYIRKLICSVCRKLRSETEENYSFMLCENRRCIFKGGGHYDCLGFIEIPKGQWFCGKCNVTCKCTQCDVKLQLGEILVSCDWCSAFGHAQCLRPPLEPLNIVRSQHWRCNLCVCIICGGQVVDGEQMLQCIKCSKHLHSSCHGYSYTKCNIEPRITGFTCLCLECLSKPVARAGSRTIDHDGGIDALSGSDAFGHEDGVDLLSNSSDSDALSDGEDDDTIRAAPRGRSFHTRNIASLNSLFQKKPLLYYAVSHFIGHGVSPFGREEDWRCMSRVLSSVGSPMRKEQVEKQRPPKKLSRVLDKKVPLKIHKQALTCEFKGVTISADCVYRNLDEVVEQILVSPVNLRNVPLHKIDNDCEAHSRWGPRLAELAEDFRREKNARPTDILLALQFASDGTATNFTQLHPISLTIFNMDRGARILNMTTSHVVVCMVPVAASLRYEHNGKAISQVEACRIATGLSIPRVLRMFLRQSAEILLKDVSKLEDGFDILVNNLVARYRCFLYSWVCDMEERRNLLNLSLALHWVCSHCFGRPAPGCAPCPDPDLWSLTQTNASRTFERQAMLDSIDLSAEELVGEEKWDFESCFGYKVGSKNPFSKLSAYLTEGGPSYFLSDRLHVLDGVTGKLWDALRRIYGPSLERTSSSFGNIACGVSTGFHFHKMEESLHDFQFVVIALLFHDELKLRKDLRLDARQSHSLLVMHFLRLVVILKDDAPGFLEQDLSESIKIFANELERLKDDLKQIRAVIELDTAKMHEIIVHLLSQVRENGPAGGFSSDVFEWMHSKTKHSMHAGSKRRDDQAVTVLKQSYYQALQSDELAENSAYNEPGPDDRFWAAPQFRLKNKPSQCDSMLKKSLGFLLEQYGMLRKNGDLEWYIERAKQVLVDARFHDDECTFSSVDCSLVCRLRQCRMKSTMGVSIIQSRNRRDHRMLALSSEAEAGQERPETGVPCCRHHDPNCELHCSFHRLRQSSTIYGFPILFFDPNGPRALILRLTDRIDSEYDAIASYRVPEVVRFEVHSLQRLRTSCLFVGYKDVFHIFVSGYRSFRHLQ